MSRACLLSLAALLVCARAYEDPVRMPVEIAGDENAVVTGELGQPLHIRCQTYGYPPPVVTWHRGSEVAPVPYSDAVYEALGNVLLIRRLAIETLGKYTCHAYNGEGKAASWVVYVKAYIPENEFLVPRGTVAPRPWPQPPTTAETTTTTTTTTTEAPPLITETSSTEADTETTTDTTKFLETSEKSTTSESEANEGTTSTTSEETTDVVSTTSLDPCSGFEFGCCSDNETEASGPNGEGCPCNATEFGCSLNGASPPETLSPEKTTDSSDSIETSKVTASESTTSEGQTSEGTTNEGTTTEGTTSEGSTSKGSTSESQTSERTISEGTTTEGTRSEGSTSKGTTNKGTTIKGTTSEGTTSEGSTSKGSTSEGTISEGTTTEGTRSEGSTSKGTTNKSTTIKGTTSEGTTSEGSTSEGSTSEGSTSEGTTNEGTTSEGTTNEGTTSEGQTSTTSEETTDVIGTTTLDPCSEFEFGCWSDNKTEASGACNATEFGCYPDGVSPALVPENEGYQGDCRSSPHGCCQDGKTPAHGPEFEGCCLLAAFGCCPDNRKLAEGPHLEGCGCQFAAYGCCPDNITIAQGPDNQNCGCQYTEHGCCPDRHTAASGPDNKGCACNTFQFGCCDDGVTNAQSPDQQGCHCRESKFGCCGDDETPASDPDAAGCDCSSSQYGCCPDGRTEAASFKFLGCTDAPENKQADCSLSTDPGTCHNYRPMWYYDMAYGGCSRFWYGGCEGNGNRFATKEECEDICVQPAPKDSCKLPSVKGACDLDYQHWYYNSTREQCVPFRYGGCLGNANNFETRELCQKQCQLSSIAGQCDLPVDQGSCAGNFSRWGFNSDAHRCEQFFWGGCEGNSNRFRSMAACQMRCIGTQPPQCTQPQKAGNCTGKEALWSFSQSENRCLPFYYSGCGGNDNRFRSKESCEQTCPSAYVPDKCTLPAETGQCSNYREKWFYDTTFKRCRLFYYGGCGGNENNFGTEAECESSCSETKTTTTRSTEHQPASEISEFCFNAIDAGPCTNMETRYAYNSTLGRCVTFQYGGCGGNQNNFPDEAYCTYYCQPIQDVCQLPMLQGPCDESLMRWFYDPTTDSCSQFTYGGCEGNDNRFETIEACENRCRTGPAPVEPTTPITTVIVEEPPECRVSESLEECRSGGVVWYFDTRRHECASHSNQESGAVCRHTGTFLSQEACERSCAAFQGVDMPAAPRALPQLEPEVSASEGGAAILRCLFHGNPPPKITWRFRELTIDGNDGRYRLMSDGALQIVPLYRNDTGFYICVAYNGLGVAVQGIHLVVNDPVRMPAGIAGDENAVVTGELGQPLQVRCLAYGYPPPSVFWYRGYEGAMVPPYYDAVYEVLGNDLLIRSLAIETLGQYTCQAYNGEGKAASWVVYVRAYMPEGFFLEHEFLVPRDTVAPRPRPQPPTTAETTTTTTTTEVPRPVFTVPVSTHITSPYATLNIGGELRLTCDVDGFPEPDVHWTRNGGVIFADGDRVTITGSTIVSRLTVARVTVADSGLYACHASNPYSSQTDSTQIIVQHIVVPAKCTDNPFFANCDLIVRSKFCRHKYNSKFCCKTCVEAGELDP